MTQTAANAPHCTLCGGNTGRLSDNGAHCLCEARHHHGQPTPSLGNRCAACRGAKSLGRGGIMLGFDLSAAEIARSIAAQFPPCPACNGTGLDNESVALSERD